MTEVLNVFEKPQILRKKTKIIAYLFEKKLISLECWNRKLFSEKNMA